MSSVTSEQAGRLRLTMAVSRGDSTTPVEAVLHLDTEGASFGIALDEHALALLLAGAEADVTVSEDSNA